MTIFLLGAMVMACIVAALFFLRFWRASGDRLFFYFAASFLLEAVNRTAFALGDMASDGAPFYYGVRLVSYLLILWAILEKNLRRDSASSTQPPEA